MLEPEKINSAALKAFATHISKVEAATGIKADRILTRGIPPFQDIATAHFKIPRDKIGGVLGPLLDGGRLNPNVLINGIPANPHFDVQVSVGRKL